MLSKKKVYLLFSLLFGVLLFDVLYDGLEIAYLNAASAGSAGSLIALGDSVFALRPWVEIFFDLCGMLFGYCFGRAGWRILYVEDRRHKHYKLDW